jgi:hypothetical protein
MVAYIAKIVIMKIREEGAHAKAPKQPVQHPTVYAERTV